MREEEHLFDGENRVIGEIGKKNGEIAGKPLYSLIPIFPYCCDMFSDLICAFNRRETDSSKECRSAPSLLDKKFCLSQMLMSVSTSLNDPRAIYKNLVYSFLLARDAPSAILAGIDTAARCIWEPRPNTSFLGKDLVLA